MPRTYLALMIATLLTGCINRAEHDDFAEPEPAARDRETREPAEGEGGDIGIGAGHALTDPIGPPAQSSEPAELGEGTLTSKGGCPINAWWLCESGPEARGSICVSTDATGEVLAIDGLPCTAFWAMHDGSGPPWLSCGGCIFTLGRTSEQLPGSSGDYAEPWLLSGRGMGCDEFDGYYYVTASPVCGE